MSDHTDIRTADIFAIAAEARAERARYIAASLHWLGSTLRTRIAAGLARRHPA